LIAWAWAVEATTSAATVAPTARGERLMARVYGVPGLRAIAGLRNAAEAAKQGDDD
jgi:hypothetical protein